MTAALLEPASLLGVLTMIAVLGSWLLWHVSRHVERMNEQAESEMRAWLEPTGTRVHGFGRADEVHERPLRPEDYPRDHQPKEWQ